ncbi:hypothetical protein H4S02_008167 [Coemansia sp. RSA 2611]|uniref:Uncharacterized protein n=1 Tax=Coemansia spiralis TaxID=417178 RepID=A0A9W8GKK0_9FUNG|nr:hypothetical protein LPJ60_003287 [Coemansia sp. RSA 2675]KAJ2022133.1 hypothetical protein GGI06_001955 [Coemansia sp. S85]KAJ2375643.1 hypothetical protein H4S02_008167 [Coemansia sp. RSA 2611]KAJ2686002.1 hypothetical protein IWW39_003907 [Coemansia spiralis]
MYQQPPAAHNNSSSHYYNNGEMSQQPFPGSQYQAQYQPPPPPQAYGASYNNDGPHGGGAFPGRMSSYSSNPMHEGPPPHMDSHNQTRPSRMSHNPSVYSQQPTTANRRNDRAGTHYGHLVSEEPRRDIPCSGDACGACCKYNSLACLFCCNGWMRLCGCGMSIKEILKFK